MATFSFNWDTRVMLVDAPTTVVTTQECFNAAKTEQALLINCDDDPICRAEGKLQIDALGTKQVVTFILLNGWKIGFEARPGPDWVECLISSGIVVALDRQGVVQASPISNQPYVNVSYSAAVSGALLDNVSGVAEAVLQEPIADHRSVPGSLAEALSIVQGLLHLNTVVRNFVYNATTGKLEGVELVVYDSKTNAQLNDGTTGVIHEFTADASYINNQPSLFRMVVEP